MLRRIELKVLATVEHGDTISELATKLDHSESYLSRAVADPSQKGLVYTERNGRWKRVVPSDARAVEVYLTSRFKYPCAIYDAQKSIHLIRPHTLR